MTGAAARAALVRACLLLGGFTLAVRVVGRAPVPGPVRAAGMLALPCAMLAVLRREERRLAKAAEAARERPVRPPAPAAPARRRR